ncbi:MAG: L-2-amino-thiazoline-4-carboxylic acid hydrolase [Candidatus Thorarchaeota archaeon]
MTQPTAEEVRKRNMFTLASAHAVYVECMRENYGEPGLRALGEANRLHGLRLGLEAVEQGALRRGDLRSIFEFFRAAYPFFGFELSLDTVTDDIIEIRVTRCPWIDGFRANRAGADICHWVCMIDHGIGQAVDPTLELSLPVCMMRGDEYCIYRFRKSTTSPTHHRRTQMQGR